MTKAGSESARPLDTRRVRRERRRKASAPAQKAFRQPHLPFQPVKVVSDDELESIHEASLDILENLGIEFLCPQALSILKDAGAAVCPDSNLVKLDRGLVIDAIKTCPGEYTIHARNPAHNIRFGAGSLAFAQMASAPNCSDADRGRRAGNQEDFRNLVKLGQMFNILHLSGGYPVEPVDLHASVRHLDCLADFVKLTDKAFHIYSLGRQRNLDGLEIARIARGVDEQQFRREASTLTIINTNSPRKMDVPMLQGIIEMSSRNQIVVITPFTLAGAMAPVTLAGALAQQNAEALAGLTFTQLVNPGAPAMYGGFTSNVDMRSGAPAFGTPEYMQAAMVSGQLARRYGLPFRTSNVCTANTLDAQAAYESVFALWGAVMGGGNFFKHAAGWLEGGLCCSYEKMMVDIELLQMVAEFLSPLTVDHDTLALEAIREVSPGGHFFGTAHTQARYRSAFYAPMISDWRNFESWQEAGSPTAVEKANQIWKSQLAEYQRPPLAPEIEEELDAFVAKRKEQGGVRTEF